MQVKPRKVSFWIASDFHVGNWKGFTQDGPISTTVLGWIVVEVQWVYRRPTADEHMLLSTMDAKVWADEFIRVFGRRKKDIDADLMLGWFANAIMVGYDKGRAAETKEVKRGA